MADISSDNSVQSFGSIRYKVMRNGGASKAAGKDVYTASVISKETYGTKEIAARMVKEGCAVKAATIRLVINEFAELVGALVSEGRSVNIGGVVRFTPGIRGTFETIDSAWDASKNAIVVNACSGNRMRAAAALSGVTRVDGTELPVLRQVIDVTTSKTDLITSQGTFFVSGERLTWNEAAEDEGWFLNYDGAETKCTQVESEQNPELAALKTAQSFALAGEPLELTFRTRMGGTVLHQLKYENGILTAVAA